jgi:FG-GAP repeat
MSYSQVMKRLQKLQRTGLLVLVAAGVQAQDGPDYDLKPPAYLDTLNAGWAVDATEQFVFMGVPSWDVGANGAQGIVIIYRRTSGGWEPSQTLRAEDGQESDLFGRALAVDENENVLVVGAYMADVDFKNSGAAYVYRYDGESWRFEQKLIAHDNALGDAFGFSVAVDGNRIVAGAIGADTGPGGQSRGAAYLFEFGPGGWMETFKFQPEENPVIGPRRKAGWNVDVDGNVVVVTVATGFGWTAVYEPVGGQWVQTQTLENPHLHTEDRAYFAKVSGRLLVLGNTPNNFNNSNPRPGSALIFERSGTGPGGFTFVQEIQGSDATFNNSESDKFGEAIDLNNGRILIGALLGAEQYPADGEGRAYLFERNAAGKWVETAKYEDGDDDKGQLGKAVALTRSHVVAGAPYGAYYGPWPLGHVLIWELPLGTSFCPARPNSSGVAATLRALGTTDAGIGALELRAEGLPDPSVGGFMASPLEGSRPFFGGGPSTLCVGAPQARLGPVHAQGGKMTYGVDTTALWQAGTPVAIRPGETWVFQAWFRDGSGVNLSDAERITFN